MSDYYKDAIRKMQKRVFYAEDEQGVLKRWIPPPMLASTPVLSDEPEPEPSHHPVFAVRRESDEYVCNKCKRRWGVYEIAPSCSD